jgi:DNA-directed RNA polymerase specialized sigma24 family protein
MSPLVLRRYRAERLLAGQFEGLRGRVLDSVRGRLRATGAQLASADLEACYAQAWQGLYTALLSGAEISNPAGWLVLVTFRRAVEEQRTRLRAPGAVGREGEHAWGSDVEAQQAPDRDLAGELDDRIRLRQLFEGFRGRLSPREREAAVLCYLHGLSRAQAAARMGVSEARMRKLMDGPGGTRPGVAGKVGALLDTIRGGAWCEEQSSLMRALAYGILDPAGERYRLALVHHGECPACRAYVVSLRGLAVVLPPVLAPAGLVAGALALVGEAAHAGGGAAAGGAPASAATSVGAAQLGGGVGAISATGAAGAGGAGSSWLLASGPLGAKLAVGCLLALGLGAGCAELEGRLEPARTRGPHRDSAHVPALGTAAGAYGSAAGRSGRSLPTPSEDRRAGSRATAPARAAGREFGLEQQASPGLRGAGRAARANGVSARLASAALEPSPAPSGAADAAPRPSPRQSAGVSTSAEREFAPG